jgi:hypothetical protein
MKRFQPPGRAVLPVREFAGAKSGRWGAGLSAAKMVACRWLKPMLTGRPEYVDWPTKIHSGIFRFRVFVKGRLNFRLPMNQIGDSPLKNKSKRQSAANLDVDHAVMHAVLR